MTDLYQIIGRSGGAVISQDHKYRYLLRRELFGPVGLTMAFIGINPSTADAHVDDATIRKLRVFAKQEGAFQFFVGNVFALRATNVIELARAGDPVGRDNAEYLGNIARLATVIVPIWGNRDKVPLRLRPQITATQSFLASAGVPMKCFGTTKSGDPRHPLYLPYTTKLQEFVP